MTTEKLNIAVAGAGLIGQAHIAVINAHAQCALVAIIDPSPAAESIARQYGVPRYNALETMQANEKVDGVIIATPNQFHVEHALTCLEFGLPVLLEKPVAPTVAEALRISEANARSQVPILVGHHRAHSAIMQAAIDVISRGELGQLVCITGSATFYKPDEYFEQGPWRREPGGGPILLNMIHEVHNLRMLCGEIVAVQTMTSHAIRQHAVEDTVAINLAFENGVMGTFLLSDTAASARSWEQTSRENKAYPSYGDEDCYVISGTRGTLSVPTMRLKMFPDNQERSWWKPFTESTLTRSDVDPLAIQIDHFSQVIRHGVSPLVSLEDGVRNLMVTEAIATAGKTGGIQRIGEH